MRWSVIAQIMAGLLLVLLTIPVHARVIKIATLSPEGSSWMLLMRQGAKDVAQQTGKRVRFKFYPGGVMGNDKSILRKISIGQLHGGAVMAGSLAKFAPDNQIYNLPLMFKSFKEVDYIRKRMDSLIIQELEKGGFVTFGLAEGGFAYLMSKIPVKTLNDLSK
ncbi:TRAP transporter substrate-binding protein DctP, partial [Thermodesulfobacteriota bacterium]